jgi:hypothetical protein
VLLIVVRCCVKDGVKRSKVGVGDGQLRTCLAMTSAWSYQIFSSQQ